MRDYLLFTYSVKNILDRGKKIAWEKKDLYYVNMLDRLHVDEYVKSLDAQPDSAYFYQIKKVLNDASDEDDGCLLQKAIILDFEGVEFDKREAEAKALFADGMIVQFGSAENTTITHMVPGDKSGSMSRSGKMIFVSSTIADALNERLDLGIDFRKLSVVLSKYYAYRGLYLSGGTRIEELVEKEPEEDSKSQDAKNLLLNKDSVIVLIDDNTPVQYKKGSIRIFTASPDPDSNGTVWKTATKELKQIEKMNRFDGQGLITPDLAAVLNASLFPQLDPEKKEDHSTGEAYSTATSFQIRLPFVKGMVHTVDVHAFIKEKLGLSDEEYEKLEITDYFDIKRKLSNVKLFLTESQFKCARWLKTWVTLACPSQDTDPMKYYFEKLIEFDHALYVSNTDLMLRNRQGLTKFNYQFLSPLALDESGFDALVDAQRNYISSIQNGQTKPNGEAKNGADPTKSQKSDDESVFQTRLDAQREYISSIQNGQAMPNGEAENGADSTESYKADEEVASSKQPFWIQAQTTDKRFQFDPVIRDLIINTVHGAQLEIASARFHLPGECRFLCRDLLSHLMHICKMIDGVSTKTWENECLHIGKCHIPGANVKLSYNQPVALFRNPHLSRNEEVLAQAHTDDAYEKWFGHLKGVLMIAYNSMAAAGLGGADFDGDLVKYYTKKEIIEAIETGAYEKREDEKRPYNDTDRKLPIVIIPGSSAPPKEFSANNRDDKNALHADYDTLRNTFFQRIGQISNASIRIAKKEYFSTEDEKEAFKDKSPECTILTGLEIDSAKSGIRPSLDSILGKESTDDKTDNEKKTKKEKEPDYLRMKDQLLKMQSGHYSIKYAKEKREYQIRRRGSYQRMCVGEPKESSFYALDHLLWEYCKAYSEKVVLPSCRAKELPIKPSGVGLEAKTRQSVEEIFFAYKAVLKQASKDYKARLILENARYKGRVIRILQLQGTKSVRDAIDGIYAFFWDLFQSQCAENKPNPANEWLNNIIENAWQFTLKGERQKELQAILKIDELNQDHLKAIESLCNFDCNGYMLLYYLAKEFTYKEIADTDIPKEDQQSDKGESADGLSKPNVINSYLDQYKQVYYTQKWLQSTNTIWKRKLMSRIRNDIRRLSERDFVPEEEMMRYIYQQDKAHKQFFWDVFEFEKIRRIISSPEKEIKNPEKETKKEKEDDRGVE